ncbi:MAG: inositol monophosphatase [Alphaproteobacteria bacterium]|nr:inositol monophosphatase [Alphaproteobacteria bacterium]
MTVSVDISRVSDLVREVSGTVILPRFRSLTVDEQWQKDVGGLVTVVDIESERFLSQRLQDLLPNSLVLGEEDASTKENPYACLEEQDPVWIIDPLDGTNNFAKGNDDFAVIVALSCAKQIRAGWIYAPAHQMLAVAEEGSGAWLDKEQFQFSNRGTADQMRGSLGRRFRNYIGMEDRFAALSNASCCGMEYLNLSCGKLDFAHFRRLKPWDHAAGDLLIREAGGVSACIDGSRYVPGASPAKGLLLAYDQQCWDMVSSAIEPVFATLPN